MSSESARTEDALLVVGFKALTSALVLAAGFRALSDDDYARIVIAQGFAQAPKLDPSGTSWLPFPFWLTGSAMALFGDSVQTARAVAVLSGIVASLLVWTAAHWLGVSRRGALLAAMVASVFPYAAWLGVATVPESLTAALMLLGLAGVSSDGAPRRWLGAAALAVACASRYEAWPVAAVFALLLVLDAVRARDPRKLLPALLAVAAPLGWMLYGATSRGSALFFVKRVADYQRAIGAGGDPLLLDLVRAPAAIVRAEPELIAITVVAVVAADYLGIRGWAARYRRVGLGLLALLAFLIAGDVRDSSATHHAERTLLAIWFAAAVLFGDLAPRVLRKSKAGTHAVIVAAGTFAFVGATTMIRPWFARRDSFIDRSAQLAIGAQARTLGASRANPLVIDTPDFAFYAVIAGAGGPAIARPLSDRDPRKEKEADPFASSQSLRERLTLENARWLVVTGAAHTHLAAESGSEHGRARDLTLFAIPPELETPVAHLDRFHVGPPRKRIAP